MLAANERMKCLVPLLGVGAACASFACGGTVVEGGEPSPTRAATAGSSAAGSAPVSTTAGGAAASSPEHGPVAPPVGSGGAVAAGGSPAGWHIGETYSGGDFADSVGGGVGESAAGASGESAAGESGGSGPAPSHQPEFCGAPLPTLALSAWQPASLADLPVSAALAAARANLVGTWQGIAYSNFWQAYAVSLTFEANGHYFAHCLDVVNASSSECCVAFSYGTDRANALTQWTLSSIDGTGAASGDIDIIYAYEADLFQESGYQGKIVGLEFDASGARAHFKFVYGEIDAATYDLQRAP
ncbi:MAG: hypothetical protein WDO69_29540 [Pseudomonadota bacterium]